nr:hypothetical protein CFP56_17493 [Quercus suber]
MCFVLVVAFSACLQMAASPTKKKTAAKKFDKRLKMDPNLFRGWEKLLSDLPLVYEPLIREFYANAVIKEDELNYWIRGREFTIDAHDIDKVLGLRGLEDYDFTNYKDRMLSLDVVQSRFGGVKEKRCLNTTDFFVELRVKGIAIPQDNSPLPPLSAINKFILTRIQSHLPGEEEEDV